MPTGRADAAPPLVDPGLALSKAAADIAHALCSRQETCSPLALAGRFGDAATCELRLTVYWQAALAVPDSAARPENIEACASALTSATCEQGIFSEVTLDQCILPPGGRADGAVCGTNSQCQGGYCRITNNGCGTCARFVPVGGRCASTADCVNGAACTNGICLKVSGLNGPCNASNPCDTAYFCNGGVCAALLPANAPCASSDQCAVGSDCAANRTCQLGTLTTSTTPGACGRLAAGMQAVCAAGSCDGPANGVGTCVPLAADGAACNQRVHCMEPSWCIGGTCRFIAPGTCN